MILRPASRQDLESLRAVLVEWWDGRDLTGLLQPLFLENFASTSLIAEDPDTGLAGFLVGFPSADDPSSAYVHFVAVAPHHRGAGLGRRLHDEFAARMSASGVTSVRCVTSPVNAASVAFHQRIGFAIESRDDEYVHFVRRSHSREPTPDFVPRSDPRPGDAAWPTVRWPIDPATVLATSGVTVRLGTTGGCRARCSRRSTMTPAGRTSAVAPSRRRTSSGRFVTPSGWVAGCGWSSGVGPSSERRPSSRCPRSMRGWRSASRSTPPTPGRTEVNPACKYLLMSWAFDHGFGRVQLKTDIRNSRSQRAIARLGADYEGVLRRYQRRQDGSVRDTVVFSVTAEDWPRVRDGLLARLG